MGAFFDVTVIDVKPAPRDCVRVRLRVSQIHADAGHLARIRPGRETLVTAPAATHTADVIRAIVSRDPKPLSKDALRALVARLVAGATPDNPARRANPLATMTEGATGDFSFIRDVRVLAVEAVYLPPFAAAAPEARGPIEDAFEIDFAAKAEEDDPYVDDPDDYANYRFRVDLEARIDAPFASHLVVGARFRPAAFV